MLWFELGIQKRIYPFALDASGIDGVSDTKREREPCGSEGGLAITAEFPLQTLEWMGRERKRESVYLSSAKGNGLSLYCESILIVGLGKSVGYRSTL